MASPEVPAESSSDSGSDPARDRSVSLGLGHVGQTLRVVSPQQFITELRARFEPLPLPDRQRALALYARRQSPVGYKALCRALDKGDLDDRMLGLFFARARHDLPAVEKAIADPQLRHTALAAAIRLPVADEVLVAALHDAPRAHREDVYGVLRRSRRRALADRLLPEIFDRHGSADALRLLSACSAAVAEEWLPRLGV